MAFRREKGLCYNCDEKWSSSHRCKGSILLFFTDSLESESTNLEPEIPTVSEEANSGVPEPTADINLHALSGLPSSETFRLYGVINHARLTILIDSGSTHNFLQPRITQFLHLPTQSTSPH